MIIGNKRLHNISFFEKIALFVLSYVAVTRVWLAFASLDYSPVFYYVSQAMNYLCVVVGGFLVLKYGTKMTHERFGLILLSAIYPFFCFFYTVNGENRIAALFSLLTCMTFIFLPDAFQVKVFDLFYKIILYTSAVSCVLYILYAVGIDIGFKLVPYYGYLHMQDVAAHYVKFFIFAIYEATFELRLCGIFNEPGGLGTVCALLFIARHEYMKKYEKLIMLVTISFTFSLAGFILIFGYYAFRIVSKNPRNLILLFVFAAVFLLLPYINFGNGRINSFFDRIAIVGNTVAGNNRTNESFDEAYGAFMNTSDKWLGRKEGYKFLNIRVGNSSYKILVSEYGIIGFGFWLFLWIYCGLKCAKGNKNARLLIIFFVISLYQRPMLITGLYGFVLLFGGIKWIRKNAELSEKLI